MSIRPRAMGLTARPPSLRGEEKQLPSPEALGEGQGVRANHHLRQKIFSKISHRPRKDALTNPTPIAILKVIRISC